MKQLALYATAALIAFAPAAFADTNSNSAANSGSGDVIQNAGNGNVYNGSGAGSMTLAPQGGTASATASPSITVNPSITSTSITTSQGGRADSSSTSNANNTNRVDTTDVNAVDNRLTSTLDAKTGDQKVEIAAQKRNPVSTAFATPLAASDEACMGSSSAAGQGVGFGLSFGSTWENVSCNRRKNATLVHNLGHPQAAIRVMCNDPEVFEAMKGEDGNPCGKMAPVASSAPEWRDRSGYPASGNTAKH